MMIPAVTQRPGAHRWRPDDEDRRVNCIDRCHRALTALFTRGARPDPALRSHSMRRQHRQPLPLSRQLPTATTRHTKQTLS